MADELKVARKECDKISKKIDRFQKEISQLEQEVEEMENVKKQTYEELRLQNIEIPLIDERMSDEDAIDIDYSMLDRRQKSMNQN